MCMHKYGWLACLHACMLSCFSLVQLCVTLWTVALQAPLSMDFFMQECWSGLPCPPLGDLSNPRTFLVQILKFVTSLESLLLFYKSRRKIFDIWKTFSWPEKELPILDWGGISLALFVLGLQYNFWRGLSIISQKGWLELVQAALWSWDKEKPNFS